MGPRRLGEGAAPRRARRLRRTGSSTSTTELAPNFKSSIIDYQVIGPYDMEQDLGLIGGNIFARRAQRWTSCSTCGRRRGTRTTARRSRGCITGRAATHAGGGVNGIPAVAGVPTGQEGQGRHLEDVSGARTDPMPHDRSEALRRMLEARSIAVVGASVQGGVAGRLDDRRTAARRVRRRRLPGEPRIRGGRRATAATRRSPRSPRRSISRSSGSRRPGSSWRCSTPRPRASLG